MSEKANYTNVHGTPNPRETALANATEGLQIMAAGSAKVFAALYDLLETQFTMNTRAETAAPTPVIPTPTASTEPNKTTTCCGRDKCKPQDVVSEPIESRQNAPGETIEGDLSQRCTPSEDASERRSKAKEGQDSGEGINGAANHADHTAIDHTTMPTDRTAAPKITPDDITRAAVALIRRDRKNSQKIQALLQTYGVSQMSALEPEKYDAFMRDLADLDKA